MKKRPVLITAITLTIAIEVLIMILVHNKIGPERLPVQMGRLIVQLTLIYWTLMSKSNTALFLLTAYHIVMGFLGMYSTASSELFGQALISFHFIVGLVIYFHDWIEMKIGIKNIS
ncbi:hypothetical protein FUAX_10400 [Fulvitalea axinellae]|uniref:Cytochrome b561 domain-containing protein n=1 Tax=Fulvitalea axinellae TaxID=1182444 RepID=A0AAU9CF96_9BACT|nr:hypothetical protein FUAX_10400 [Fulvitalea axinellae]